MGLVLGDQLELGLVYQRGLGMVCQPELELEQVRAQDVVLERGQHMVVGLALVCQLALDDLLEPALVYLLAQEMVDLLGLVYQPVLGMVCLLGTERVPVVELERVLELEQEQGLEQALVCQLEQVYRLEQGLVYLLAQETVCRLALVCLQAPGGQLGPAQARAEGMEQARF